MLTLLNPSFTSLVLLDKPASGEERHVIVRGNETLFATFFAQDVQIALEGQVVALYVNDGKIILDGVTALVEPSQLLRLVLNGSSHLINIADLTAVETSLPVTVDVVSLVLDDIDGLIYSGAIQSDQSANSLPLSEGHQRVEAEYVHDVSNDALFHSSENSAQLDSDSIVAHSARSIATESPYAPEYGHFSVPQHDISAVDGMRSDSLSDILRGERLDTPDDEIIQIYDGAPIIIGAPVILKPVSDETGQVRGADVPVDQGIITEQVQEDPPSSEICEENTAAAPFIESDHHIIADFKCSSSDDVFVHVFDEHDADDVIMTRGFDLGSDTLELRSVIEIETIETLLDNDPQQLSTPDGDVLLSFTVAGSESAHSMVAFADMSLSDYLSFLFITEKGSDFT